jgi:type 1 glutamine amidotransferase
MSSDFYLQDMDNFSVNWEAMRDRWDVVLFYNMNMNDPQPDGPDFVPCWRTMIDTIGENGNGVFLLHHSLLSWPQDQTWSNLVGIADRRFGYYPDQDAAIGVAAPDHPITRGLGDFTIHDETYTMEDPGGDSEVLLTTEHSPSMSSIAWTRNHKNSKVFCLQLGHDDQAWSNPAFRTIVDRGIKWLAGRI